MSGYGVWLILVPPECEGFWWSSRSSGPDSAAQEAVRLAG